MDEGIELSQVAGTVTAVLFRNEDNGYTVLRLDEGDGCELTVVGCMPGISPGEGLEAEGRWIKHATYGEQFKAETVHRTMPVGEKAVFEYLASRAIRGIGPRSAQAVVDQFGADALTVIEEDPEQLTRLRGFTRRRALAVHEEFMRQAGMRRLLDFLGGQGLSAALAMPLWRRFGPNALDVLRVNPYILTQQELGVEFSVADTLAISLGMEGDDPQRLEAGLLFELEHNAGNGHTFLPEHKLLAATQRLLNLEDAPLSGCLEELIERGEVVREDIAGQRACYLAELYAAECYVSFRLGEMSAAQLEPPSELESLLGEIQAQQGITYAPQQVQAVRLAASRQVILLTGGPGTGKTTCLRGVLALFEALGLSTALTAPTGRAAKRLGELCGLEAATIHRLLETRFDPQTGRLSFAHNQDDPLRYDAVIVDETSMVDLPLMQALLSALRGDCRLVLVGDPDQLPSVGPGNLLSDLLRSGRIPSVRLTEIFRQAAQSAIVRTAHAVNQGQAPGLDNQGDFFFLRRRDAKRTAETIVELVSERLPRNMGIPPEQIQVLSPTRRHGTGTANLNRLLQQAVNPPASEKGERRFGDIIFRAGDRVMQVKNNYDVMWKTGDGLACGLGIFNGDIGHIVEVDNQAGVLTVDFDGRLVEYTPDMLGELESAYAVTVHKAQGSEYRAVILAALDGSPRLLTRGILYTAITRARELFIVVGDEAVVAAMAANDRQQRRYSGLRARLRAEN